MLREATKEELANMTPVARWAYERNMVLVILPEAKAPSYTTNKNFLKFYLNIQKQPDTHKQGETYGKQTDRSAHRIST